MGDEADALMDGEAGMEADDFLDRLEEEKRERKRNTVVLTRDEKRLLLYLETVAVDGGLFSQLRLNDNEKTILNCWNRRGFVRYGKVANQYIKDETRTHWCRLSVAATAAAAKERHERAERMWSKRNWKTTEELQT